MPMNERNLTGSRASKARSVQPLQESTTPACRRRTTAPSPWKLTTPPSPFPGRHERAPRTDPQPPLVWQVCIRPCQESSTPRMPPASERDHQPDRHEADETACLRCPTHLTSPPVSSQPLPTPDVRSSSYRPRCFPARPPRPPRRERPSSSIENRTALASRSPRRTATTRSGHRPAFLQPRSIPQGTSSRLPAPKTSGFQNAASGEDEEDVPPVPAIPKVYESPKNSPAEISFLEKTKPALSFDTSSTHSNSTGSLSVHQTDPPKRLLEDEPT